MVCPFFVYHIRSFPLSAVIVMNPVLGLHRIRGNKVIVESGTKTDTLS